MKNALVLPMVLMALGLTSPAWADSNVTRTLTESPAVPAGAGVEVQNLVGHMTVTQGARFQVTATVIAGGSHAHALAQAVKLDVNTQNNLVTVHVHYPVDEHDNYRQIASSGSDKVCVLGVICFHGHTNLDYQGKRVSVYQGGDTGVPLNVNVVVTVPAGMPTKFVNKVGLLEANGLANTVGLESAGSDIHASKLSGDLTADTNGGDLHVQGLTGNLHAETDGGDAYLSQSSGDLNLQTDGGDVRVNHITGALVADTDGGDLYVAGYQGLKGKLHAATDGGDVDLSQSVGDMQLDTGGGEVRSSHATGSLVANTDGGDVNITDYTSGSILSMQTGGGDLRLSGDLGAARDLNVRTGGGDVILKISNLSMHLDASSDGGDLSVHLPEANNVVSSSHHFSSNIGKASGKGSISSDGGDITISG